MLPPPPPPPRACANGRQVEDGRGTTARHVAAAGKEQPEGGGSVMERRWGCRSWCARGARRLLWLLLARARRRRSREPARTIRSGDASGSRKEGSTARWECFSRVRSGVCDRSVVGWRGCRVICGSGLDWEARRPPVGPCGRLNIALVRTRSTVFIAPHRQRSRPTDARVLVCSEREVPTLCLAAPIYRRCAARVYLAASRRAG